MNTPAHTEENFVAVILVQRQTVDWQRLSDTEFREQSQKFCALWAKPADYVWQLFQLWNKTFTVDYRTVRQQLKDLSLHNVQQARNTTFVPYQHYQNIPQQSAYYLFLDDDDWVDPQISTHLQQHLHAFSSSPALLLWRSANIGSPHQEHVVFVWGMNGRCMTNNYAAHSAFLQPFSKIQEVLQHKDAEQLFSPSNFLQKSGEGIDIPHLDCALTVSNKSPISSVSLDRGLDGELSPEKLIKLVESYLERMHKVQDSELVYMPWSKPLIQKTIAIFEKVIKEKR